MSYFHYIACSRRLETDHCSSQFLTVYPSYEAYMRSENYNLRRYRAFDEPLKAAGSVHFYSEMQDAEGFSLYPFTPPSLRDEEDDFVAGILTQPYIYSLGADGCDPDYLLKHLKPGDQLEYLCVFLGHDETPQKPVTGVFDMQYYLEHRDAITPFDFWQMICTPPDNRLTRIIPACNSANLPCTEDSSDCICTIFRDKPCEWWDTEKLRRQGLF